MNKHQHPCCKCCETLLEIFVFLSILAFFVWIGYASAKVEFAGADPALGYICTRRQPY